ncbi:MAG TPA: VOC family protein [Mycobacteriales bacterium]|nr:VOC family protein [Mycobacteriales bacterium]
MGIGRLRCAVLDVDDLDVAEAFWSEVTGLPVITSKWVGRYSYLGQPDPWKHEVILHLVRTRKTEEVNRAHVDIGVADVDLAITQIEAIGGQLKRVPTIFPRPGSYDGVAPTIDWAVMRDPFGNEFCLVSHLTEEESLAVAHAGLGDDTHYRAAAGRTSPKGS